MKRNSVLIIVNPILGVLLINQIMTGLLHKMLPHETFEILHKGGGIVLMAVAVLHVILNWNWIKANFFRKQKTNKT